LPKCITYEDITNGTEKNPAAMRNSLY
jgi:hypothetical protein